MTIEQHLDDWKDLIGSSACICTILQTLSPLPTCYNFIKKQSVGDMIVTPYTVAFTSCFLWLLYGYIIGDKVMIRTNKIGSVLQLGYNICYYIYSQKKTTVRRQFSVAVITIVTCVVYSYIETDSKRLESSFGFLCSFVTVLFFISPLGNIHYVLKIWNSESLPRLLILASFVTSFLWALYGHLIEDRYIFITSVLGLFFSGLQLLLILIIPRDSVLSPISNI